MDKQTLFLDIGDETVKVWDDSLCSVEYFDKFGVFDSRDFREDVVKKAILKVLAFRKEGGERFLVSLPPKFLKARVSVQRCQRSDFKKVIDKTEERKIIQDLLSERERAVSRDFAEISGIMPQDVEFLDQEVLGIEIDGYEVPQLLGRRGKEIEFRILSVFSPRQYLGEFRRILEGLGISVLKIVHPIQKMFPALIKKDNAVFLDIGGETTQIFLVKNRRLEAVDDFEMGGRDFSAALSQKFGLTEQESRTLKETYSKGDLGETSRERISEIFYDVAKEWLHCLKYKLKTIKGLIPSAFFIFGGASQLPEIEDILTQEGWEVKKWPRKE